MRPSKVIAHILQTVHKNKVGDWATTQKQKLFTQFN